MYLLLSSPRGSVPDCCRDPFTDSAPAELTEEDEAGATTVDVELDGEIHHLKWPRKQTLVDIMLAKGIDVPYSHCQEGECGSCACTVIEGKVQMDNTEILDPEDIENGYILGCQSHPVTDHLRIQVLTQRLRSRRRVSGSRCSVA